MKKIKGLARGFLFVGVGMFLAIGSGCSSSKSAKTADDSTAIVAPADESRSARSETVVAPSSGAHGANAGASSSGLPGDKEVTARGITPEEMKALEKSLQDIHFEFDKSDLTAEARETLSKNAKLMQAKSRAKIIIEGHCDERGTSEYNLALGERRANSARQYLISLGIGNDRLSTVSYGEEKPLDAGHTDDAWNKNRRAHFLVTE